MKTTERKHTDLNEIFKYSLSTVPRFPELLQYESKLKLFLIYSHISASSIFSSKMPYGRLHITFTWKTLRIKPGNDFKSNKKIRNSGPQAGQRDHAIPLLKQQTRFGIAIRIRTDPFGSSWRIHCALKWTPRKNTPGTKTQKSRPTFIFFGRRKRFSSTRH